jgi:hypothetical protein
MAFNWNDFNNQASVTVLESGRLPELLEGLGCDRLKEKNGRFRGPCPIHGGDHDNFQVTPEGDSIPIRWRCFSHHCQEKFKPSLLGLVRGVLSFQSW